MSARVEENKGMHLRPQRPEIHKSVLRISWRANVAKVQCCGPCSCSFACFAIVIVTLLIVNPSSVHVVQDEGYQKLSEYSYGLGIVTHIIR
ncbi:hypothetical protein KQX54_018404 [Cotesia glomerata]|uniref:Uncharacterized protein n=1 Tax=Cotesia glomerata TaxID=32391 RepID=A0AAV7IU15_COTGL|nr:hypothetical protein KQX54_018404 [Cotesia glomerata]